MATPPLQSHRSPAPSNRRDEDPNVSILYPSMTVAKASASGPVRPLSLAAATTCIILVAVDIRPAIVCVGPLLPMIRDQFGLSNAEASLLTTIPAVLIGLLAFPAPWLAHRFGRDRVILLALGVLMVATGFRAFAGTTVELMVATVGVGAGIALAGALMPTTPGSCRSVL